MLSLPVCWCRPMTGYGEPGNGAARVAGPALPAAPGKLAQHRCAHGGCSMLSQPAAAWLTATKPAAESGRCSVHRASMPSPSPPPVRPPPPGSPPPSPASQCPPQLRPRRARRQPRARGACRAAGAAASPRQARCVACSPWLFARALRHQSAAHAPLPRAAWQTRCRLCSCCAPRASHGSVLWLPWRHAGGTPGTAVGGGQVSNHRC